MRSNDTCARRALPVAAADTRKRIAGARRSSITLSLFFQRYEIADDIGQLLRAQLVAVRRHRRFLDEAEVAQVRLLKRSQLLLGVEDLHRERVQVEQPARRRDTVARHDTIKPVASQNLVVRIDERGLDFDAATKLADVAQVGTQPRSVAADAVTTEARTFVLEHGFSAFGDSGSRSAPLC